MAELNNSFYQIPDLARQVGTKKEVQDILLRTEGTIMAQGRLRFLKCKSLGAGVYELTLKPLKE